MNVAAAGASSVAWSGGGVSCAAGGSSVVGCSVAAEVEGWSSIPSSLVTSSTGVAGREVWSSIPDARLDFFASFLSFFESVASAISSTAGVGSIGASTMGLVCGSSTGVAVTDWPSADFCTLAISWASGTTGRLNEGASSLETSSVGVAGCDSSPSMTDEAFDFFAFFLSFFDLTTGSSTASTGS
ncbi:hypothetical protein HBI73_137050 [Parastagonospora nodorum]|nr:hypothetical protein HBI73_137050 [Parastagonospora nodorum]